MCKSGTGMALVVVVGPPITSLLARAVSAASEIETVDPVAAISLWARLSPVAGT